MAKQRVYAVVSQKGGVGKTSISVSLAVAHALEGKRVLLADLDAIQQSACEWYESRSHKLDNLTVKAFKSVKELAVAAEGFDVVIADGAPHASAMTIELAEVADKVIIPTGTSMLDLRPSARLAFELTEKGIDKKRIGFALMKVTTAAEAIGARDALAEQKLKALGAIKVSTGFSQALDDGRALQEASHASLREHANKLIEVLRNE
ncbi:Iron-sulfur cluster carrier protein [compost metagenome]